MECPNCGSQNDDAAESCGLCSIVFKKEVPPTPSTVGPAKLDTDGAISILLSLAVTKGKEGKFEDSEKLMARLYLEAPPDKCRDLIFARGDEWLKAAGLSEDGQAAAQALIVTIGGAVGDGELDEAAQKGAELIALIPAPTAESFRLRMLISGIRAAVDARNR